MKLTRKKLKPSKALGKKGSAPKLRGGMVKVEPVPTRVPGRNEKEPKDHLVLYCTNGFTFIRVDLGVKENMDEPGPIPAEALKHIEKGVAAELGLDFVKVGITRYERVLADAPYADVSGEAFPDFEETMDKHWSEPRGSNRLTLNVNPKLLLDAAEAIGAPDNIELVFDQRKFIELEHRVQSAKERRQHKGKRRRFYSGPIKMLPRKQIAESENPAMGYLMPILPSVEHLRDDDL